MFDYIRQLGENRMSTAKLQAAVSSTAARADFMKSQLSKEKTSKQKCLLKYVREQMRNSDVKILLAEMSERTKSNIEELERKRAGLNNFIANDRVIKDTLGHLIEVAEELAANTSKALAF